MDAADISAENLPVGLKYLKNTGMIQDVLPVLGGDTVGNLGAELLVLHHQNLQFLKRKNNFSPLQVRRAESTVV